jgi:hypothetical protein
MTPRTLTRTVLATTALGALAIAPATAPGDAGRASAPKRITAAGVGQVKLGKTFAELRERGLLGRMRPGCELGGPNTRSARLKAPLKGTVDLNQATPRRVRSIVVEGGAKARGVGIGATIAQIKAAFPKAKVDRSTEEVFRITLVRIPKNGGGRIKFAVDVDTGKTILIGVPFIGFCE